MRCSTKRACARSEKLGEQLTRFLNGRDGLDASVAEVLGLGSMVAVEFFDSRTGKPLPEAAKPMQARALGKGLLLLTCGIYADVIRFLYPLTMPDAQFDAALGILNEALDSVAPARKAA